jgi:hypothetical protein
MTPETFAIKLREDLQSEKQKKLLPNLLPFLRSHLMTLRRALQNEYLPARYHEVTALKNLMKAEGLEIMAGQSSNHPHPATVYPQTQSTVCATNSRSPGDHLVMVSAVHQHKTKVLCIYGLTINIRQKKITFRFSHRNPSPQHDLVCFPEIENN